MDIQTAPANAGGEAQPIKVDASVEAPSSEQIPATEPPANDKPESDGEIKEDLWPKKAINALSRKDKQLGKTRAELYQERQLRTDLENKLKQFTEAPQKTGAPDPSKFETHEAYLDALTDYKVEQRLSERDKKSSEQRKQTEDKIKLSEREEYINENALKAAESFQDFETVMQNNVSDLGAIAPHVRQALLDADNGAFALYALAKEGVLGDLNDLPPHKVVAAITRMEDKAIAMSKNKPVTKAPAPISSNKGTSPGTKKLNTYSGDELLKWVHS